MATIPVFDADGHIIEKDDQLAPYLEGPFKSRSRSRAFYPWDGWDRNLGNTLGDTVSEAKKWLELMDKTGLETTVLFPTNGLFIGIHRDSAFAAALCKAYNTFVAENFCRQNPRLKAVAMLPPQNPAFAVEELRRGVKELGLVGAMLAADGPHLLGRPEYHPVYEEAERLGTTVTIHGSGSHMGGAGVDFFDRFIQAHTVSHPFAQMRQVTSVLFEGVPEKFPQLKIAFLEAGITWVPYWLDRMDEEFHKRGKVEAPLLKKKPSEYVKRGNIYFSCEAGESLLGTAVSWVGEDRVVYASDFPHWDAEFPESIAELLERKDLSERAKKKILYDNGRALYGLS